jgi:hypothetical protein
MLFREIIAVYCENYTEHVNRGRERRERSGEVVKDITFRVRKKDYIYPV